MRCSVVKQLPSTVFLFSIMTGSCNAESLKERSTLPKQDVGVWSMAVSPDGRMLATGMQNGEIKLWEVATAKERAVLRKHDHGVVSLAFSRNGKMLASGGR